MVIDMVMNKRAFVVNERPLKRRKRVTADYNNNHYYDFLTFPAPGDFNSDTPFRFAIHNFLLAHAKPIFPDPLSQSLTTWEILFRIGLPSGEDPVVTLYVIEEDVTTTSRSIYCDQCRVVGWSRHPVCNKRYHFIIGRENFIGGSISKASSTCKSCNNVLHLSDFRCKSCNYEVSVVEVEKWLYNQLEDNTHVLHGVIHSNGYGHLLTLNGQAGGSNFLTGCDIMNFWDRLCQTLSVRKITVMDVSKKYGIEYRLIHSIANGHPWYGNWGYEFGAASYALTLDAYKESISTLSNLPLSLFSHNPRRPRTHLQNVIAFYQSISDSKLNTARDLFSFMLKFISKINKSSMHENPKVSDSNVSCIWSTEEVGHVEQAAIKVLQAAANWVPKRALKGSLSKTAPQDLLEYCLQHLGGKVVVDNTLVVNTRCNHNTMAIEFRLERLDSTYNKIFSDSNHPLKEDIVNDLKFLYDSILNPHTMENYKPQATREIAISSATKILDCKQLVKNYKPENMDSMNSSTICISCHVELEDQLKDDPTPPPELMILPKNVTVGDLKLEATKAFRELYVTFKGFEVDNLLDFGPLDDTMTLQLLVGLRGSVRVKGQCIGSNGLVRFKMERGTDNWIVDCMCGAKDDDGERMLACDDCDTWQHTRCAGIGSHEEVPTEFVCKRCLVDSLDDDLEEDEDEDEDEDGEKSIVDANKNMAASKSCRNAVVFPNFRKPRACFTMSVH